MEVSLLRGWEHLRAPRNQEIDRSAGTGSAAFLRGLTRILLSRLPARHDSKGLNPLPPTVIRRWSIAVKTPCIYGHLDPLHDPWTHHTSDSYQVIHSTLAHA